MSTLASGKGAMTHWVLFASTWVAVGPDQTVQQSLPWRGASLRAAAPAHAQAHPFAPGGDDLLPPGEVDASPVPPAPLARPLATVDGMQRAALAAVGAMQIWQPAGLERRVRSPVPLPVQKTSDANLKQVDFDLLLQPSLRGLGLLAPAIEAAANDVALSSLPDLQTVGDFFQEGRAARWVIALTPQGASQVYVLARDEQGRWQDRSEELLPDAADRQTCDRPSQALTADFNADGKPDVYLACDGQQLLFLSQANGRYRRAATPFQLSATQAQALDVDGDGLVDVLTIDIQTGVPRVLVLYGRGDGCFGVQLLDPSTELARALYQRSAAPAKSTMPTKTAGQGRV